MFWTPHIAALPARLIGVAIVAFGIVVAARVSLATLPVDPDIVSLYLLDLGMQAHGIGFLKTFRFTIDNWTLSLLPILSLTYSILGAGPWVMIGTGWAIFLACVGLTVELARRVAGPAGAALLGCLLLFPNVQAYGPIGMLAYPISHNSSLAWGLLVLLCCLRGLRSRHCSLWYAAATVATVIVTLSDPWALAAVLLPVLLTAFGMGLMVRRTAAGPSLLGLGVLMLVALVLVQTRLLGAMRFLPKTELALAGAPDILENASWALKALGGLFHVLPGIEPGGAAGSLASLVLLTALVARAGILLVRYGAALPVEAWFLVSAGLLSIGGVAAGLLIGQFPHSLQVERFLCNADMLVPLLLLIAERSVPAAERGAGILLPLGSGVLWAVTGLVSAAPFWTGPMLVAPQPAVAFVAFLQGKGLSYGYGPYWGAFANAATWASRGTVVVRPVRFDDATGEVGPMHEQSSPFWSLKSDASPGQKRFFLAIADDGETCPRPDLCIAAARRTFGEPDTMPVFTPPGGSPVTVLVWGHPLTNATIGRDPPPRLRSP